MQITFPDKLPKLDIVERASRYVRTMDPGISGQGGHNACFKAACKLVIDFGLNERDAMAVLQADFNPRCVPPFNERELQHKVKEASKQGGERGKLAGPSDDDTPPWERQESLPAAPATKDTGPKTTNATAAMGRLMGRLREGEGDVLYQSPEPFEGFECGPEKISVVGAPPGAGKTALVMQYVFGLLESDPKAEVVVANAEMTMEVLLRRELTRRSGVPGRAIRFADCTEDQMQAVEDASTSLMPVLGRIKTLEPPYTSTTLASLWGHSEGGRLLVIDYLQKFASGDDPRIAVNDLMGTLRTLAHDGWGILALSSVARVKKQEELSMSSFKESGEIEFNADSCYLLRDEGPSGSNEPVREMKLDCVKNRHGELGGIDLIFDKPHMTFSSRIQPFDFGMDDDDDSDTF